MGRWYNPSSSSLSSLPLSPPSSPSHPSPLPSSLPLLPPSLSPFPSLLLLPPLSSLPSLPSFFSLPSFPLFPPSPPSLRIRVVGLDNFRNSDVEVVYIEAGIYHGGELLVGEKFTSEVTSTTYPRWNQWLVFDIAVKNLPKVGACYSSFSLSPPVFSPLSPFPNFPLPPLSSFTFHQSGNRRLSIQIPFLILIPRLVSNPYSQTSL